MPALTRHAYIDMSRCLDRLVRVSYNVEIDVETTDPATWCGSELNEGGACTLPNDRHSFNAHVSQQDLVETFLPPFQQAVKAQAGAIMCSYNAVGLPVTVASITKCSTADAHGTAIIDQALRSVRLIFCVLRSRCILCRSTASPCAPTRI